MLTEYRLKICEIEGLWWLTLVRMKPGQKESLFLPSRVGFFRKGVPILTAEIGYWSRLCSFFLSRLRSSSLDLIEFLFGVDSKNKLGFSPLFENPVVASYRWLAPLTSVEAPLASIFRSSKMFVESLPGFFPSLSFWVLSASGRHPGTYSKAEALMMLKLLSRNSFIPVVYRAIENK